MALVLKRLYTGYFWIFNELADPRAEEYFLSSPLPAFVLICLYFKFIYDWGPRYMEKRPPYKLKEILIVYNILQVVANAYLGYRALVAWLVKGQISLDCSEIDYSENGRELLNLAYYYYLTKIADLLDTVFFVLRKKNNQVSFLHVYHHFGMTFASWVGLNFLGGGHSVFLGMVNVCVHAVMYLYYLLSVVDKKYKKTLWLKKFITQIQLAQFIFLLFTFGQLLFKPNCKYPKIPTYFLMIQNLFMITMFSDFYYKTYIRKKAKNL